MNCRGIQKVDLALELEFMLWISGLPTRSRKLFLLVNWAIVMVRNCRSGIFVRDDIC